jgi:hypothetical protein
MKKLFDLNGNGKIDKHEVAIIFCVAYTGIDAVANIFYIVSKFLM